MVIGKKSPRFNTMAEAEAFANTNEEERKAEEIKYKVMIKEAKIHESKDLANNTAQTLSTESKFIPDIPMDPKISEGKSKLNNAQEEINLQEIEDKAKEMAKRNAKLASNRKVTQKEEENEKINKEVRKHFREDFIEYQNDVANEPWHQLKRGAEQLLQASKEHISINTNLQEVGDVVNFLSTIANSSNIRNNIGAINAREFQEKVRDLEDKVAKAEKDKKTDTLKESLDVLKSWSEQKEKATHISAFSKISTFLVSAVKVVHYSIRNNKEEVEVHKDKISQMYNELSGEDKKFSSNIKEIIHNPSSFAEKILQERQNKESAKQR